MNFENNNKDKKIKSPKTEKTISERIRYTYEPTSGGKEEKPSQKPKKKDR